MKEINAFHLKTEALINHLKRNNRPEENSKPFMILGVNGLKVTGRIDSGADILTADLATKLKLVPLKFDQSPSLAVNSSEVQIVGIAPLWITYDGIRKLLPVVILPQLKRAVWAWDFLYEFKVSIDFGKPISSLDEAATDKINLPDQLNHPIDKIECPLDSKQEE